MLIILYILLILLGLFYKPNKYFDLFVIIFLSVISFLGRDAPDFENYQTVYNYIGTGAFYSDTGKGWYVLCRVGNIIGLNFAQFKSILTFISLMMIRSSIKYFGISKKTSKVIWVLYLVFPALLDCIQIRFLVASALFIFSIRYLIDNNLLSRIKYIFLLLIASSIHSSLIFYFIFLVLPFLLKIKKIIPIIVLVTIVFFIFFKNYVVCIASLFINSDRIVRYFYSQEGSGIIGVLIYFICYVSCYVLINSIYKILKKNLYIEPKQLKFIDIISQANLLILITLPLVIFDTNFIRIQRPLWFLNYIILAMAIEYNLNYIKFSNILFKNSPQVFFFILAIFGNLIFITLFSFNVVTSLLL